MTFLLDTNVVSASRRPYRQAPEFQAFLHGFDIETATKLRDFIGRETLSMETIVEAFQLTDDKAKKSARMNQGVSGRGEKIPQAARERLKALTWPYRDEVDFSRVL